MKKRAVRPVPAEVPVVWTTATQLIATVARDDRRLGVSVQVARENEWAVVGIETTDPGKAGGFSQTVERVLDDHAHQIVGMYDSLGKAIEAAEGFARAWVRDFKATRAETCECDVITNRAHAELDELEAGRAAAAGK